MPGGSSQCTQSPLLFRTQIEAGSRGHWNDVSGSTSILPWALTSGAWGLPACRSLLKLVRVAGAICSWDLPPNAWKLCRRNLWMERNQSFCIAAFTRDVFTHVSCWQGRLSGLHLLGLRCNLADVPNTSSVTLSWRRIGVKCKQATSLVNFGGRPHSQLCGPLIGVGPQLRHREGFIHASLTTSMISL